MNTAQQPIEDLQAEQSAPGNRLMQALLIAAIAASSLSMVFSVGTAMASASDQASPATAQVSSAD